MVGFILEQSVTLHEHLMQAKAVMDCFFRSQSNMGDQIIHQQESFVALACPALAEDSEYKQIHFMASRGASTQFYAYITFLFRRRNLQRPCPTCRCRRGGVYGGRGFPKYMLAALSDATNFRPGALNPKP